MCEWEGAPLDFKINFSLLTLYSCSTQKCVTGFQSTFKGSSSRFEIQKFSEQDYESVKLFLFPPEDVQLNMEPPCSPFNTAHHTIFESKSTFAF